MLWHKWLRSRVLTGSVQVWYRLGSPIIFPWSESHPSQQSSLQWPVDVTISVTLSRPSQVTTFTLHSLVTQSTWHYVSDSVWPHHWTWIKTFPEMCTLPAVLGLQSSGDKLVMDLQVNQPWAETSRTWKAAPYSVAPICNLRAQLRKSVYTRSQ